MNIQRRATIIDVARRADVSPGTVSNALTGKRPVSPATRERILEAIDELGYQPNLLARGLVNQRTGTLAVVASGLEYYGPSRTLVGIDQMANKLGYTVLLDLLHSPVEENVEPVLQDLAARRVDGIIWAVHEVGNNRAWINEGRLRQLPPIVFLTMSAQNDLPVITIDNRTGAALVIEHLLAGGRQTIGLITGPLDWWEARERKLGWQQALEKAGLAADESLFIEGNWSASSGEECMRRLLARRPDIDAVFACNDQMALGALRTAHLLGRHVPQDVAIVGYDNIPEAAFFWPPLSSVKQHLFDLGSTAVRTLHQLVEANHGNDHEEPQALHSTTLLPELIVRESSDVVLDS